MSKSKEKIPSSGVTEPPGELSMLDKSKRLIAVAASIMASSRRETR